MIHSKALIEATFIEIMNTKRKNIMHYNRMHL